MKKLLVAIFLVISNCILASEILGQIYNLEKSGMSYKGRVDGRIFSYKNKFNIKLIPERDIEILKVNGTKKENNVYEIEDGNLNVEFIYKSKLESAEEKIVIGRIEYLNEIGKTDILRGEIAIEFRKKGKLSLKVRGSMDFGLIPSRVPKNGISSKKNPEITLDLGIDKKDVGNTKLYFQYPKQVVMADGQLVVTLNSKNKVDFLSERTDKGEKVNILGFFPKKDEIKEKIILDGRVYSTVNNVKPGEYKETVVVKAFYEYLDYSIEKNSINRKVIIRR
ncbi:MAG: hypothetical protein ACRC8M_07485 [Cetobacterium sp.]|uniref:hypothetical protein n=1 Tax=Cetobacterium sp. TaxID=2071632 RepID=UPI003F3459C9